MDTNTGIDASSTAWATDNTGAHLDLYTITAGGIGLTGPGALSAARAALIAALSTPETDVIINAPDFDLITDSTTTDSHCARLWVTDSIDDSLILIQREVAHHTVFTHQTAHPRVILIATPSDSANQLRTALDAGASMGISAILLTDHWPRTAFVADNGNVTTTSVDLAISTLEVQTASACTTALESLTDRGPATATLQPLATTATPHTSHSPAADTPPESQVDVQPPKQAQPAPVSTARTDPALTVTVMGGVTITVHDRDITSGLRARGVELLVYLSCHRWGAPRTQVIDKLLADVYVKDPAGNFRTILSDTRKQLTAATGLPRHTIITETDKGLLLNPETVAVDAWRFTDSLRTAAASTDPAAKTMAWEAALAAYGGDFADGLGLSWATAITARLRGDAARACRDLSQHHLDNRDYDQAVEVLLRAIDIDPVDESTYRALMRVHAEAGNHGAITALQHQLTQTLAATNTAVSAETTRLAEQLRRSDSSPRDDD